MILSKKSQAKVPIVYYHSIGPVNFAWKKSFLTLDPNIFEEQLIWLKERYTFIFLRELWQAQHGAIRPFRDAIILTFDDGYLDNWIWAFPLLKKHGVKATIFVSPQFVDQETEYRPNHDDYRKGNATLEEITKWGFLSWTEMRIMENSGLIDIQSHTMTHTKYFVSDEIIGFHHPDSDSLHYITNIFPEKKPYYITDKSFDDLVPYGYPVFNSQPSIIARKVEINQRFVDSCIISLEGYDFHNYIFSKALGIIQPLYEEYREGRQLITSYESQHDYLERIKYEIVMSKKIIEEKLNKTVEFLCWPFGENTIAAHEIALEAGYLMTTRGKFKGFAKNDLTRIPERIGINLSSSFHKFKTLAKLKALGGDFPYSSLLNVARFREV